MRAGRVQPVEHSLLLFAAMICDFLRVCLPFPFQKRKKNLTGHKHHRPRSFAVRVDTLRDSIQLVRTDLRPIDGFLRIQVDRGPIPLLVPVPRQCGAYLLSRAVPPSQPLTPSVGSTPEGVSLTPGLIITTAPGTEKTQTRSRGSPSTRGHAGSVSLHAHIPGDIASFTTQHGAEGAVLTTTSQCEFRSLAYL